MNKAPNEKHSLHVGNSWSAHKETFKYLDKRQEAFIPQKWRELQG